MCQNVHLLPPRKYFVITLTILLTVNKFICAYFSLFVSPFSPSPSLPESCDCQSEITLRASIPLSRFSDIQQHQQLRTVPNFVSVYHTSILLRKVSHSSTLGMDVAQFHFSFACSYAGTQAQVQALR